MKTDVRVNTEDYQRLSVNQQALGKRQAIELFLGSAVSLTLDFQPSETWETKFLVFVLSSCGTLISAILYTPLTFQISAPIFKNFPWEPSEILLSQRQGYTAHSGKHSLPQTRTFSSPLEKWETLPYLITQLLDVSSITLLAFSLKTTETFEPGMVAQAYSTNN